MQKVVGAAAVLIMAGISAAAHASGAQPTRSSQSAPAAFDACALLTKQEAATAVGEAVGEPKPLRGQSGAPGMSVVHCEYESATSQSVQVTVWRFSGDTASMSLQIYRS